jgi:hypothetical protein
MNCKGTFHSITAQKFHVGRSCACRSAKCFGPIYFSIRMLMYVCVRIKLHDPQNRSRCPEGYIFLWSMAENFIIVMLQHYENDIVRRSILPHP